MSVLGDRLVAAREKKGLTISQAAIETHIRGGIIEALEASEYQRLPPPPFTRGLLRNYVYFLGLDPELSLEDYDVEIGARPQPATIAPAQTALLPGTDTETPYAIPSQPPPYTLPSRPIPLPPRPVEDTARGFGPALGTRATPSSLLTTTPEPVFQVAAEALIAPVTPPPDPPTFIQRISKTKLPEVIAAVAVAVTLMALGLFGYGRLFPGAVPERPATVVSATMAIPSPSPFQTVIKAPTAIPVLEATVPIINAPTPAARPTNTPLPSSSAPARAGPQMTLQITANDTMWVWVISDNVEVFKGELKGATKTWIAYERLYLQIKNLPNGTVLFDDKPIKASVFGERQLIERAWEMSAKGVPLSVDPKTLLATPASADTLTPSPSATSTPLPTSTRTPTVEPTETPAG
ncbi:MAG: helix-turn-helix domain-containing protein [Anaerolineae bacterium]